MKTTIVRLLRFIAAGSLLSVFALSAVAALQAPKSVTSALRVLNQVVAHTGRLIAAKDYKNVGGEHGEFTEGAAMLREALRGEPADFVAKVDTALTSAVAASESTGKLAASSDDAEKIAAAHADFAAKVTRHVLASFGPTIQGPAGYQAYLALQFTLGPNK
jgi:hypothetical protein